MIVYHDDEAIVGFQLTVGTVEKSDYCNRLVRMYRYYINEGNHLPVLLN